SIDTPYAGHGAVNVTFFHPEGYSDAGVYSRYLDAALREVQLHLQKLGERSLPQGQELRIEVLDISLAGRFEPSRPHFNDVRVLRSVTWPSMKLRYTLEADGKVLLSAKEHIADMNYLSRINCYSSAERFRYEKQMLDDWFAARIVGSRPPTI
ncbi:MAG: DUF3016 domain-containing protein, partial [Terriglobales bacterium]